MRYAYNQLRRRLGEERGEKGGRVKKKGATSEKKRKRKRNFRCVRMLLPLTKVTAVRCVIAVFTHTERVVGLLRWL